jgi:hypothetical protein
LLGIFCVKFSKRAHSCGFVASLRADACGFMANALGVGGGPLQGVAQIDGKHEGAPQGGDSANGWHRSVKRCWAAFHEADIQRIRVGL